MLVPLLTLVLLVPTAAVPAKRDTPLAVSERAPDVALTLDAREQLARTK